MARFKAYSTKQAMELIMAETQSDGFEMYGESPNERLYRTSYDARVEIRHNLLENVMYVKVAENDSVTEWEVAIYNTKDPALYAYVQSQMMCVRIRHNSSTKSTWIWSFDSDREALEAIIAGAIRSFELGKTTKQQAADVAETQAWYLFNARTYEVNGYESVYNAIMYSPFEEMGVYEREENDE